MAQSRVHQLLLIAAIIAVGSGCSLKMDRVHHALRSYERALTLEVIANDDVPVAGPILDLRVTLTNVSPTETVRACLGITRQYTLMAEQFDAGRKPVDQDTRLVDHPGCERRFELNPGQKLEWVEHATLNIGPGDARLSGFVSVVHPADCDRTYGCYETFIKAAPVRLTVR